MRMVPPHDRFVPDAHRADAVPYDRAKDAISVADQIAWRSVPRECLRDLAGNPIGRWAVRHGNVDQLAAIQSNDNESIKQLEGKRRDHEQVHRRDLGRIVLRNVHQLWPDGPPCRRTMYFETVD